MFTSIHLPKIQKKTINKAKIHESVNVYIIYQPDA